MEERKMYPDAFERTHAVVAPVEERDMKAALSLCEALRASRPAHRLVAARDRAR